ncbi:MAG: ATPase [Sphingobacteriia bacterium]|nr:ATPase [Sphingobacteriia bacterium]NCC38391.1 ATPase [Gammaproteobacteria bacterium]
MKFTVEEFRHWPHKCVTLLGMSGVGKTYLSEMLRRHDWFHYSGDYRIGTRYLSEHILDLIKAHAMRDPFLRDLLRRDWISIHNNIKVTDLGPVLSFVGKVGNPELGGLPLAEFSRRQALYRDAEIAAMLDVPDFVRKAQSVYDYAHLVNDVGGSLCELEEPRVIDLLAKHSLILYIRVPEADEIKLIQRAQADPKPLYYRPEFLRAAIKDYLALRGYEFVAEVDPNDFTRWVFPRLFHSRVPRYEAIARPYGYTVSSEDIATVRDEHDFLGLIESAIAQNEVA